MFTLLVAEVPLLLWKLVVCFKDTKVFVLAGVQCISAAYMQHYVLCNRCRFYLPTEHLHSVPAASPRAGAYPHISIYADDGHQPALQSLL